MAKVPAAPLAGVDPVTSEVIKNALIYASEEMGIAVRNAAYSPNIKERLDHSCAIFDRTGRLIAQAEHIPVHLGSLPWGLRETLRVLEARATPMRAGEMWVVNDPYISGTHLNDVTVIRPVFYRQGGAGPERLVGYAANKAHHTDVGGSVPGSMSPDATDLCQEGLVIAPLRLMQDDRVMLEVVDLIRANSRTPDQRSGDLKAQIAGSHTGERRLIEVINRYGMATFDAAIEKILAESERRMRVEIGKLAQGTFTAEDFLEDQHGKPIIRLALRITIEDGSVIADYEGTSAQVPFPINAVYGVTLSGVYYALRAVIDPTIPMNEGCFRPIDVRVPLGTVLNPRRPAPVAGGNVETSQRNADVMLRALAQAAPDRVPAACGGTMSNVMLGGVTSQGLHWTFYETNGSGMGGRPHEDGVDGIQCNMTNTLNTPIEAIERYFPLRITRYEFAEGTGGAGRHRGGNGLIRRFHLTDGSAVASLLADRHTLQPWGLQGGEPGTSGKHTLTRGGKTTQLAAKTTVPLEVGDELSIQTPGGGGYGKPAKAKKKVSPR